MTTRARPPKKSEKLEVRLSYEAKQEFLALCQRQERSASEVLRAFIAGYVAHHSKSGNPARRSPWRFLQHVRTLPATVLASAGAALMLAMVGGAFLSPVAMAQDDIAALSTDFDDAGALTGWTDYTVPGFPEKWAAPAVEDGALILRPFASSWYGDMQGGHLYRQVSGDFIVTARLRVDGTGGTTPDRAFSLAGLFVRAPHPGLTAENWQPGEEDWLFFSTGSAVPPGTRQFEIKTTDDSLSTLKILPAPEGWIDMRIARHGELFTLLWRGGGEDWQVADQMIRPDLPQTLNVGLTAYADWPVAAALGTAQAYNLAEVPSDGGLVALVDSIDFRRPVTGRFPIASLDPGASFAPEISQARLDDLMAD